MSSSAISVPPHYYRVSTKAINVRCTADLFAA